MNSQKNKILKSEIEKELNLFFEKLEVKINNYKIEINNNEYNIVPLIKINLIIDNIETLIGEEGNTLIKLQHIFKIILKKKVVPINLHFYLNLDINNYKEKKEEYLKLLAEKSAEEIILSKEKKLLDIMPSYERRIIHLALQSNNKVTTESISQGKDKRVLIKLKSIK